MRILSEKLYGNFITNMYLRGTPDGGSRNKINEKPVVTYSPKSLVLFLRQTCIVHKLIKI